MPLMARRGGGTFSADTFIIIWVVVGFIVISLLIEAGMREAWAIPIGGWIGALTAAVFGAGKGW
jgi:hypothetical protein